MTTQVTVFSHPGDGLVCSVELQTYDPATGGEAKVQSKRVVPKGETQQFSAFPGQLVLVEEITQAEHDNKDCPDASTVPAADGSTSGEEAA